MTRIECIFTGRFNGGLPCIIEKYLGNGSNGKKQEYCSCGGDFSSCHMGGLEVSTALLSYWDSPERISHQNLWEHARIENGKKII